MKCNKMEELFLLVVSTKYYYITIRVISQL